MSTCASDEVFVDRYYITDLRHSLNTQKTTEVILTRVRSVGYDPEHCSTLEIGKAGVGRRAYTMRVLVYNISAPLCKYKRREGITGCFWEGVMSLATSALRLTGSGSVKEGNLWR